MSLSFVFPLLVVAAAFTLVQVLCRWLPPRAAAQAHAVVGVAAASAWLWTLFALTFGALAEQTEVERWVGWCPRLYLADDHVPWWVGLAAGSLLAASLAGIGRVSVAQIRLRRALPDCDGSGLLLVDSATPIAFTVPGRRGGVVVSRGMMAALDRDEQSVLWAHERAHLRNHHHRYLLAADLVAGVLPLLRPLAARINYSLERWADEDSASETGDRRLVARAIAKAALASVAHRDVRLAMASSSVPARVDAMLTLPRSRGLAATLVVLSVTGLSVMTVGGSTVQLHHLFVFARHLCGGG